MVFEITRIGLSNEYVDNWLKGESDELKKWIGFGFYKTEVKLEQGAVTFIYEEDEIREFEEALSKCLDEDLFDRMCDRFFELVELEGELSNDEIEIQCMPILTIFDEISKYPEWATEDMLRRLIRIRENYHEFIYKLGKK